MGKIGLEKRIEKNNRTIKIIFFLFSLILLGSLLGAVKKSMPALFVSTTLAQVDVLEDTIEGEGLIFLREKLIIAPYSGSIKFLQENGQRVGKNQGIAKFAAFGTTVSGKNVQMTLPSPIAGVLLYWWDGLENVFSEDILGESDIEKLFTAGKIRRAKASVGEGENIAKVVDNLEEIYYVVKLPLEQFNPLPAVGDRYEIKFADFITLALVRDLKYDEENLYLLTELDKLPPAFIEGRHLSCELVKNKFRGVILPQKALIAKNNSLGVYILDKKKAHWKEVRLVGAVKKDVVVEGLTPSEVIILNPKWIAENEFNE